MNTEKLIKSRCRYDLCLTDMIICDVTQSIVSEYIQDFLPSHMSAKDYFRKANFYFYPVNYGYCIYHHNGYFVISCYGDRYELGSMTKSVFFNDILFLLFWLIAYSLSHYHLPSKPYKEAEERKIEIFLALIEKAGIY
ncbi:MAG: hypothetical protein IJ566_05175 [Cardiobacteriaceae bacterium]|nr:hypothetical protein [Cardiobacteriaceae bacterium]